MDPLIVGVYAFIILAIFIIFFFVIKVFRNEEKDHLGEESDNEVEKIKKILKSHESSASQIYEAMYHYIDLKDLSSVTKSELNEAFHVLLLYLKHPKCDAKLFAKVLLDLEKRYPKYKYQFEAMGEQALVERKHQEKKKL